MWKVPCQYLIVIHTVIHLGARPVHPECRKRFHDSCLLRKLAELYHTVAGLTMGCDDLVQGDACQVPDARCQRLWKNAPGFRPARFDLMAGLEGDWALSLRSVAVTALSIAVTQLQNL